MFYQKNIDEMERPKLNMFQKGVYVIVFIFGKVGTTNDIFIHTIVMQCHPYP
jgi:hypothetical protein